MIVRDVASGQVRETFQGGGGRFAGLRFSPDGRTLSSAATRSVIAWDLEGAGRLGRPFSLPGAPELAMAVSPDGSVIATPDGPAVTGSPSGNSAPPRRSAVAGHLSLELGDLVGRAHHPVQFAGSLQMPDDSGIRGFVVEVAHDQHRGVELGLHRSQVPGCLAVQVLRGLEPDTVPDQEGDVLDHRHAGGFAVFFALPA